MHSALVQLLHVIWKLNNFIWQRWPTLRPPGDQRLPENNPELFALLARDEPEEIQTK